MRLTILIIITLLGLMLPLFWIIGTVAGMISYYRHEMGATHEEQHAQLGLTMADGGDSIEKEKKE